MIKEENYNFKEIEKKWQKKWEESKIFEAKLDKSKPKKFITFPYPYMDGHLHVGHAFTSLRCEIYSRFKRLQGFNVLFPWAWHWTGEPIVGASKRIAKGDKILIEMIQRLDKIPKEEITKFTNPVYMAKYYTEASRKAIKRLGYSIDWKREFFTTSYHKEYSTFISWQYNKLRKLGYVIKSSFPVVWCPKDKSPTGDHDRLEGEGIIPIEVYLIKFKFKNNYLLASTLRPETIFGVTNIWIKADDDYVKINVNGEKWIVNYETVEKLKEQGFEIKLIEKFKGKKLIGEYAEAPLVNRKIIILPAEFIDPFIGTGIVYSVPSHAPYDWLALKDLKENLEKIKEYNLNIEEIKNINPISIIKIPEYKEHPAIEIVKKLKVKDQKDLKAEEATKIVYLNEFNKGIMKENCLEFSGMKVSEAKTKVIEYLTNKGFLEKIFDLPSKVVCRCGTRCIAAILKDQWFLKYSDNNWKEKALLALSRMKIYPEEARNWFITTINWLEEKPCVRKSGLGTPLPWDKKWIVETLSDSTIYMSFYIISKFINNKDINYKNLKDIFYDYVFLGIGNKEEIAKSCNINEELLEKIREEFLYWYPVDLRVSAKELLPNHLTFYIFHHVAIFPEKLWPKAIGINGMVNIEGKKLSKSKGNVISINEAVENFGADTVRLFLALSAEGLNDCEWRWKEIEKTYNNLVSFYNFLLNLFNIKEEIKTELDNWLVSVFQRKINEITKQLEILKIRSASNLAFYGIWNDIKWYLKRVEKPNVKLLREIINEWLKILSIIIPHICEELWEKLGNKDFISVSKWPEYKEELINPIEEAKEILLVQMYEDIKSILRKKKDVKKVYIYLPRKEKYEILKKIHKSVRSKEERKILIKNLIMDFERKIDKKEELVKIINEEIKHYFSLKEELRNVIEEAEKIDEKITKDLCKILLKENLTCNVLKENRNIYDPLNKSKKSLPYKLGFYFE